MGIVARRPIASPRVPWVLPAPAVLVGAGICLPIAYLAMRAMEADPATLRAVVLHPRNALLLQNTLLLVLGVLAGTVLLAFPLAWLEVRSDAAPPPVWTVLGTLPLAIPDYVGAYALLAATGPGGTLDALFGIVLPRPTGYWGAVAVLSLFLYPYLYLNLRAALRGLDPSLEESARTLGYGPWAAFVRSVLPQLRPALLSGGLLVVVHVLGDFATAGLVRYETLSFVLYLQYSAAFDRTYAAWLALLLVALVAALVWAEARSVRGLRLARTGAGAPRPPLRAMLGRWRWLAHVYLACLGLASIGLPLLVLAHWTARGGVAWEEVVRSLLGTVRLGGPAALWSVALALPIAYWSVRYPSVASALAERVTYFGYAIPPLSFALALVFFTLRSVPVLYQTLPLLVGALALHSLSEAVGPIRAGLYQAPPRLEEAARSLGYGPVAAFWRATVPALRSGILAGFLLVFLSAAKDLALTSLLSPPGYTTLALRTWGYASEAMFGPAAWHALAQVGLCAAAVGLLIRIEGRP
jgi:iron(III) transport system permease protein